MKKHRIVLFALAAVVCSVHAADPAASAAPVAVAPRPLIAVPAFRNGSGDRDVAAVVEADLVRSGRLLALPRAQHPQQPASPDDIDMAAWRALGVQYLILGAVIDTPQGLGVRQYLVDVAQGQQLMGFDHPPVQLQGLRYVAHQVADMDYEKLLGLRGSFNSKLAYVRRNGSGADRSVSLMISDIDGYAPRKIADSRELILSPAWSPDRRRLAYSGYDRGKSSIYVHELSTGVIRRFQAGDGVNGSPAWSPDGTRLALAASYERNTEIVVLELASGQSTRLTRSPAIDTEPTWSPDGRSIAFTSDREGSPQIFMMGADGSAPHRLTQQGQNFHAAFSPEGRQLAMSRRDASTCRIVLMNLADGSERELSPGPNDESPGFAPNGEALVYTSRNGNESSIGLVSIDGRVRTTLRQAGDVSEAAWSPNAPR